ncbi:MAG: cytochrome-c peroxidase [Maritimibacter sp.]
MTRVFSVRPFGFRLVLGAAIVATFLGIKAEGALAGPVVVPEGLPTAPGPADFPPIDAQAALLGQSLFYDPILSGNENIACATCHHPTLGSSDGMSLSIGEGGEGLGPARRLRLKDHVYDRIPRNAPALWNKGSTHFQVMFHDGRVMADADRPFGVVTPQGDLEGAVMNLLAAQAMFPMTSADEMAGQNEENETAKRIAAGKIKGEDGAWALIAAKVAAVPAYRAAFDWVIGPDQPIHITDIANALASFMTFEFRSTDSPFDNYLRGDEAALSETQKLGMALFYGDAGCAACHAGPFQTDQNFHAMGMPQIGPGKRHVEAQYSDIGRGAITGDRADDYKFRTPSLRNVTLTAPYGHAGAYATLEAVIQHHRGPAAALALYDSAQAKLHPLSLEAGDFDALADPVELDRINAAIEIEGVALHEGDTAAIIAFLTALEDPVAKAGRLGVPDRVLSGLPMDEDPQARVLSTLSSLPNDKLGTVANVSVPKVSEAQVMVAQEASASQTSEALLIPVEATELK